MATEYEVLTKVDELLDAIQGLINDPAFRAYRNSLTPRYAALFSAREGFSGDGPGESILATLRAALAAVQAARPSSPSVSQAAAAIDRAIEALRG
jgi:hypothetical protein